MWWLLGLVVWYAQKSSVHALAEHKIYHCQRRARHSARLRLRNLRTTKRIALSKSSQFSKFYIPVAAECTIVQNQGARQFVYLACNQYKFFFPLFESSCFKNYDPLTRVLGFSQVQSSSFEALYQNAVNLIITSLVQKFFRKIKFRGKGYKLARGRQRNTLTFQFGHSHRIFEYTYLVSIRAVMKQALIFYGTNLIDVDETARNVRRWRPINIYTGRGIRFNRQSVYRKQGKVKSYK
jgi:ribosomal protein L6P/L9E